MGKVAVFAGTFDPFTVGHKDIAERACEIFDELIILVANNVKKQTYYSAIERKNIIKEKMQGFSQVRVDTYEGLTVDYLKNNNIKFLVRGIRRSSDLEKEQALAWNNAKLLPGTETVFLSSKTEHLSVSSSLARELLKFGKEL